MHYVSVITLGCPKNQVDSEMIKGLLLTKGSVMPTGRKTLR